MMFDLVTIGHSTIDYFLKISQAEILTPKDGDSRICLDFADKIPVEEFSKAVGGNAPNAAVGCARLGLKVAIISWVGRDTEAETALSTLKEEGVELFWVKISENEKTDESVIINFEGERTILAYHFPRKYTLPVDPPEAKQVYLTSTGEDFSDFHQEVLGYVGTVGAGLSYNPGMHELAAGAEANREILEKCEVLLLNIEEAGELVGSSVLQPDDEASVQDLLEKVRGLGPQVVVATAGAEGAYGLEGDVFLHVPAVKTKVVEKTGAGDSFSAAFLAAQILGKNLEECLKWGVINGASVISQVGSQAGLLTKKEMKEAISE